jgi:nucleotide-binding universal stress UspA family protein
VYKHLIVPLDGSAWSEAILPLVAQLARQMRARVTLIHVIEEDAPQTIHGERHLTSEADAVVYLEQVKEKSFPPSIEVRVHVHESAVADVAQSIAAHAVEFDADLIAICTHGRGSLPRFIFGSLAQQVLDLGRKPVLVLYPHKWEKPGEFDPLNLLVPLDGNPENEQGFRVALQLAQIGSASIHLVMAVHTLSTLPGEQTASAIRLPSTTNAMLEVHKELGLHYLQGLIRSFGETAATITAEVRRGDPTRVIVKAARRAGSNLIVMAAHSRSSMESFWLGSLTPKIARRSHIPMLLVPVDEGSNTSRDEQQGEK